LSKHDFSASRNSELSLTSYFKALFPEKMISVNFFSGICKDKLIRVEKYL
jgi:hypothetical protein